MFRMWRLVIVGSYTALCGTVASVHAEDRLYFSQTSIYPDDHELSDAGADSEGAQGLAFDGSNWYFANTTTLFRISGNFGSTLRSRNFGFSGCAHIGGIEFFDRELYVAVDNCSDGRGRIYVLDSNLGVKRSAILDGFPAAAWVAVNPLDSEFFYAPGPDTSYISAFRRHFSDGETLVPVKKVYFQDRPESVVASFPQQGGAFSQNGLFFRVVDDAAESYSAHTGVWVYEIEFPIRDGVTARRVGFIGIQYSTVFPANTSRNYELEDLHVSTRKLFSGNVHVIMLSNELFEDDISIYHYVSGDFDGDGISDTLDNCVWLANGRQLDLDKNGVGIPCDRAELSWVLAATAL